MLLLVVSPGGHRDWLWALVGLSLGVRTDKPWTSDWPLLSRSKQGRVSTPAVMGRPIDILLCDQPPMLNVLRRVRSYPMTAAPQIPVHRDHRQGTARCRDAVIPQEIEGACKILTDRARNASPATSGRSSAPCAKCSTHPAPTHSPAVSDPINHVRYLPRSIKPLSCPQSTLNLPVLGLVDSDPYGLKILSVYMSG